MQEFLHRIKLPVIYKGWWDGLPHVEIRRMCRKGRGGYRCHGNPGECR